MVERLHPAIVIHPDIGPDGVTCNGLIHRCTLCDTDPWGWRITDAADIPNAITESNNHVREHHMTNDHEPGDPFTAMATMAASLREMYESLITGGFTDAQALYLVGQALTGGKGTPPA